MVAVATVTQLLGVVQTWLSTHVGQRVMHELRTAVFTHLQRQSLGFFTRTRAGEVQSRLTNDVNGMQGVVTSTATSIAANLTTAVATAVAMVALSWRLSLLSLLVIPPALWLTRKVALLRRAVTAAQQRHLADLNHQIEEGLSVSGVRLAKTLGTVDPHRRAVLRDVRRARRPRAALAAGRPLADGDDADRLRRRSRRSSTSRQACPRLGRHDDRHARRVHDPPGRHLPAAHGAAQRRRPVGGVDGAVLAGVRVPRPRPSTCPPRRTRSRSTRQPCVATCAIEGVRCGYAGADRDAVADVTLSCPPASTLALVGADRVGQVDRGRARSPGCTTRIAGRVTVDGMDVRDLDPDVLASVVGVVSRRATSCTRRCGTTCCWRGPHATDGELWAALAAAQVADLVASLPDALETVVGARGHRFSGGEQQRLADGADAAARPAGARPRRGDERPGHRDRARAAGGPRPARRGVERRSRSRTGSRPCAMRTGSRCSTTGRLVESGTHDELVAAAGVCLAGGGDPAVRRLSDRMQRCQGAACRARHREDPRPWSATRSDPMWIASWASRTRDGCWTHPCPHRAPGRSNGRHEQCSHRTQLDPRPTLAPRGTPRQSRAGPTGEPPRATRAGLEPVTVGTGPVSIARSSPSPATAPRSSSADEALAEIAATRAVVDALAADTEPALRRLHRLRRARHPAHPASCAPSSSATSSARTPPAWARGSSARSSAR